MKEVFLTAFISFSGLSSSLSLPPIPADDPGCFKINSCQCIMKDGSGVINLNMVGDPDGFLVRFRPVAANSTSVNTEVLLAFSPCQQFSEPEEPDDPTGGCTGVAACLVIRSQGLSGSISHHINYGRHRGSEFHYNHSLKTLSVSYFAARDQLMTVVHYHCSPNRSTSTIRDQSLGPKQPLQIWVESPCACPNACSMGDLGLGTIFLIILSLSAAAYFVLGSCALRPFRSHSGVQISPEHSVWCIMCFICHETLKTPRRRQHRADKL